MSDEKRIRAAVEVIVTDVLTFAGASPLSVARTFKQLTHQVAKESEGYKMLLAIAQPIQAPEVKNG